MQIVLPRRVTASGPGNALILTRVIIRRYGLAEQAKVLPLLAHASHSVSYSRLIQT